MSKTKNISCDCVEKMTDKDISIFEERLTNKVNQLRSTTEGRYKLAKAFGKEAANGKSVVNIETRLGA
jgi:hypothetical protein